MYKKRRKEGERQKEFSSKNWGNFDQIGRVPDLSKARSFRRDFWPLKSWKSGVVYFVGFNPTVLELAHVIWLSFFVSTVPKRFHT